MTNSKLKDSNIEWLGKIPSNWNLIKGKYLFTLRTTKGNTKQVELLSPTQEYGVIPQKLYEKLTGMRPVKLKSNTDLNQMKSIYKGDFCISLRSFQGGFEYSNYDGIVSPAYQVFYPSKQVNRNYFKYLFKDKSFIQKLNSYTMSLRDGKNIAFSDFGNTYLPFPALDEQNKIADFLDKKVSQIDDISKKIQQEITDLEKYRKSIITKAVTKGLNPNVPMKNSNISWIGEVPSNWHIEKLKFIAETRNNKELLSNVQNNYIGLENIVKNTGQYVCSNTTYEEGYYDVCKKGDILYGKLRPNLSKVLVAPFDSCCSGEFLIFKSAKINLKYLFYYLLSQGITEIATSAIYGTKMPRVSWDFIKNLFISFPPKNEDQKEIVNYLDIQCNKIDSILKNKHILLKKLNQYKQSIIYEYVTGKKQVPTEEGAKK